MKVWHKILISELDIKETATRDGRTSHGGGGGGGGENPVEI
jgi:hypothetical protein